MQLNTYDEAAHSYLRQFQDIRKAPAEPHAAVRGAGDIAAETLVDKADIIADISKQMIPLAGEYFEADDPAFRESISIQFLAQATAELEVAAELLQITGEATSSFKPATRAVRGVQLYDAIDELERVMATPLAAGIVTRTRRAAAPSTVDAAKRSLEEKTEVAARSISQRVSELGGDIAFDLVMKSEWAIVVEGAGLISTQIADLLDKLQESVGALLKRAVTTARRTLINVYDKILALLGKELESQARRQIKEWLDQIEQEEEIDLFATLVSKLYRIDALKADVKTRLEQTNSNLTSLNDTTRSVTAVADKFAIFTARAGSLERVLVLAKVIKTPEVLTVIAGLQVALLAVIVYAGYDYIGYAEPRFPNLTQGIGELVRTNLSQ